ncbi:hypothetical protein CYMTET_12102 [Cymbomonas tetramitiformis]|uniref:Uncharacterized protein n=1 Tax=Cymbomonas tetramitiformis TaxID=36881 RepID=A0AAE0GMD5_9CHLO|nr:hypothetical protein CYMTET_12102 [Cymbomonas tetramitiformis]
MMIPRLVRGSKHPRGGEAGERSTGFSEEGAVARNGKRRQAEKATGDRQMPAANGAANSGGLSKSAAKRAREEEAGAAHLNSRRGKKAKQEEAQLDGLVARYKEKYFGLSNSTKVQLQDKPEKGAKKLATQKAKKGRWFD